MDLRRDVHATMLPECTSSVRVESTPSQEFGQVGDNLLRLTGRSRANDADMACRRSIVAARVQCGFAPGFEPGEPAVAEPDLHQRAAPSGGEQRLPVACRGGAETDRGEVGFVFTFDEVFDTMQRSHITDTQWVGVERGQRQCRRRVAITRHEQDAFPTACAERRRDHLPVVQVCQPGRGPAMTAVFETIGVELILRCVAAGQCPGRRVADERGKAYRGTVPGGTNVSERR